MHCFAAAVDDCCHALYFKPMLSKEDSVVADSSYTHCTFRGLTESYLIAVYDQSIQGYVVDWKDEAEIKEYMLNAALESWQKSHRPGWIIPSRPQPLQAPHAQTQTQIDNDFYAL